MEPRTHNVNPQQLRKKLIKLYTGYIKDPNDQKVIETAKDTDGQWSGSFLLSEDLEAAIENHTFLYVEPKLPLGTARKILKDMQDKNV